MGQDCVLSRGRSITCAKGRHATRNCLQTTIDSGPSTSQVKHRFSKNSQDPHVAKSDLGTKRICPTTGKKFYDLNKSPVISPYTGEVVPIAPVAPPRAARGDAARAAAAATAVADTPEPAEAEELVPLEEADAEENSGKVKAVVPESEDDIEIDETIEDDDDDDSTFI